jgi:hypothetical protein
MPNMVKVSSSWIHSIGFEPLDDTMTIRMNNGSIYEYPNTNVQVFISMLRASSKGKAWHRLIGRTRAFTRIG